MVTGTDAGEREDFMTEKIREYNNGRPMESKAWTEKLGVFQCFQKIHNMVQDKTGDNLMDDVIDNIIKESDFYEFGARRLDKIISREIENVILEAIINNVKDVYIDKLNEYEKNITKS